MIVVVAAVKGGVGKSMIATNLTAIRAIEGKRVLLVDGDEQGTSSDWTAHRMGLGIETAWTTVRLKDQSIRTEVLKLVPSFDDIVIDVGGRDSKSMRYALTIAEKVLIPFQPRSFDIWTVAQVEKLIEEARIVNPNLVAHSFINCAAPRSSDNESAEELLSNINGITFLPTTIALRRSFSNATSEGLSVYESNTDSKAISEIRCLYDALFA